MKAISKMKSGKAADPSGIVVEMIKAASDTGTTMIHHITAPIIHEGKVPTYWEQSFIVCLYKGKGDALDRGNYSGLKLTDDSQFNFFPGGAQQNTIFVVQQPISEQVSLYLASMDLEKVFFDLILYAPVINFSVVLGLVFLD